MTPREIAAEFGLPVKMLRQHGEKDFDGLKEAAVLSGHIIGHRHARAGLRNMKLDTPPELLGWELQKVRWAYEEAYRDAWTRGSAAKTKGV